MSGKKTETELYPHQGEQGNWAFSEYDEGPYRPDNLKTKEEAISAGLDYYAGEGGIYVGQIVLPAQPWEQIDAETFVDQVINSDQYAFCADWCDWGDDITKEQEAELTDKLQEVCKEWCEKHGHTATHFLVENIEWVEEPKEGSNE